MSKAIFLTGTGTDIGKTFIAGLIVKKLAQAGKNPAYYKAAMSGNDRRSDESLIPGDALLCDRCPVSHSRLTKCALMYMKMPGHHTLHPAWKEILLTSLLSAKVLRKSLRTMTTSPWKEAAESSALSVLMSIRSSLKM